MGCPNRPPSHATGLTAPTKITDALGGEWQNFFDAGGNLVGQQFRGHPAGDPGGDIVLLQDTLIDVDKLGRPTQIDQRLSTVGSLTPLRPVQLSDGDGNGFTTHRIEWDAGSRPTVIYNDNGGKSRIDYDGAGRIIKLEDAAGNTEEYEYDDGGNTIKIIATDVATNDIVPPETSITLLVPDQFGRTVRVSNNAGETNRFEYDCRDQLIGSSNAVGPLIDDPIDIVDPLLQINDTGNTVTYTRDGLGRIIKETFDLRVDGLGGNPLDTSNSANQDGQVIILHTIDDNNRQITHIDDNGNSTTREFDKLGRLEQTTFADGTTESFTYDHDDNLVEKVDANGSTFTITVDALNRTTQIDIDRAPGIEGTTQQTFFHDGLSRVVAATDDNGGDSADTQTIEFVYDSRGNIVEERQNGEAVSSNFSGDSEREQMTMPGGRVVTFTYDPLGQATMASDPAGTIFQSNWLGSGGNELTRDNSNGTAMTVLNADRTKIVGLDPVNQVVEFRVTDPGGGDIINHELGYDRVGVPLFVRSNDRGGLTDEFNLDSLSRVVEARVDVNGNGGGGVVVPREVEEVTYQYDGVGNRVTTETTTESGTVTKPYVVNEVNAYTDIGSTVQVFDLNGNRTGDGTNTYIYDAFNRFVGVENQSGDRIATYNYDAGGRLARLTTFDVGNPGTVTGSTNFIYDGNQLVEQQDGMTGATEMTIVNHSNIENGIVQIQRTSDHPRGSGTLYVHQNPFADIVALTDVDANVVQKFTYDSFGNRYDGTTGSPIDLNAEGSFFGFRGLQYDGISETLIDGALRYDSVTGRSLQRVGGFGSQNFGDFGNTYRLSPGSPAQQTRD